MFLPVAQRASLPAQTRQRHLQHNRYRIFEAALMRLASQLYQLRIYIFTNLTKQRIGSIAQRQHTEFDLIKIHLLLVNMIVEFLAVAGGSHRLAY